MVFSFMFSTFCRTKHTTKGDIPPGTSGAAAYHVGNSLYVFAGHTQDGNTNSLYKLDLQELAWTNLSDWTREWPSPRDKFACWSYDNK